MGDVHRRPWALIAVGLTACSFSGGSSSGQPADAAPDAADDAPRDAGTDADPICDPMQLNLTLNNQPLSDFNTKLPFAVGDSINLNAGASCSPTGNLNFTWTLGAGHFVNRGSALDEFFIEVYPDDTGDLQLEIAIDDGVGTPITQSIPIIGIGFGALDIFDGNPGSVDEMLIADGRLWVASERGAVTQAMNALNTRPYDAVNAVATNNTATIPSNITDVAYDADNDVVSFLPLDGTAAFFFDRVGDDITSYAPADTGVTGILLDAQPLAGGGVRLLSAEQFETSTDYSAFTLEWTRDQTAVTTEQGAALLAGGDRLFRFVAADMSDEREIFNVGMDDPDGIVTFFEDANGALWIGSDQGDATTGIAVIDDFDDMTIDEHLLGERVRSIGQDAAGDMWVATANGVARFKSDWGVWITLGAKHGLSSTDSRALIVDEAGGRDQILVGTDTDLFILRRP